MHTWGMPKTRACKKSPRNEKRVPRDHSLTGNDAYLVKSKEMARPVAFKVSSSNLQQPQVIAQVSTTKTALTGG